MLEHNGVTQQQVRRREAGYLVVREVPRHDAQQWTERLLTHYGFVRVLGRQVFICKQFVSVLGVIAVNIGNNLHLGLGPTGQLAHLAADMISQFINALFIKIRCARKDCRAFLNAGLTPCIVGRGGTV